MVKWIRDWFRDAAAIDVRRARERAQATSPAPARFRLAGRSIRCVHCDADSFVSSSVNLSSTGAALLDLEWLGPSATALRCAGCGLIALFAKAPEREATD